MTSELLYTIPRSCITELWCQSCCVTTAACQHCCITAVWQQQGRCFTAVWMSELLLYCSVVLKLLQHWCMATGPLIHYCVLVRWHLWSSESATLLLLYCSVVYIRAALLLQFSQNCLLYCLGLEQTIHVIKSQIHLVRQSFKVYGFSAVFASELVNHCCMCRVTAAEKYFKSASQVCNYRIYVLNQGVFNV